MTIPYTLKVKYRTNFDAFRSTMVTLLIIMGVGGLCVFVFHVYNYHKVNPRHDYSDYYYVETFFYFIFYLGDIFASVLFYFLWIFSGYFFIIYKFQQAAVIAMDNSGDIKNLFEVLLIIMFTLKCINILQCMFNLQKPDIFFIDWEDQYYDMNSKKRWTSIWRSINVGNAFADLIRYEYISVRGSLIVLGFFITGLNFNQYAYKIPYLLNNAEQDYANNYFEPMFSFFLSFTILFFFGHLQITLIKAFEIWYPTPVSNFIDLCCVTNISVFIMEHDQFHGYYIHGQIPGGHSDRNQAIINDALRTEAMGNLRTRGLISSEDNQSFELFVPMTFFQQFQDLYSRPIKEIVEAESF